LPKPDKSFLGAEAFKKVLKFSTINIIYEPNET